MNTSKHLRYVSHGAFDVVHRRTKKKMSRMGVVHSVLDMSAKSSATHWRKASTKFSSARRGEMPIVKLNGASADGCGVCPSTADHRKILADQLLARAEINECRDGKSHGLRAVSLPWS